MTTLIERALKGENLQEYEGYCGEVADMILHEAGGDIIHMEPAQGDWFYPSYCPGLSWKFHIVARVRNRIYDAWYPGRPCTLNTYLQRVFPDQLIEIMVNGKTPYYQKMGRRRNLPKGCPQSVVASGSAPAST